MKTLDYFRGPTSGGSAGRSFLRVFISHRARVQLARSATVGQGLTVLAVLSLMAGVLSAGPGRVQSILRRLATDAAQTLPPGEVVLRASMSAVETVLITAPIYFAGLCLLLAGVAWVGMRCGKRRPWSRCFVALAAAATPLVWFFVLVQLEGLTPLLPEAVTGTAWWNPFTNHLHFGVLMIGIPLLGVWLVDANRVWMSLDGPERAGEMKPGPAALAVAD